MVVILWGLLFSKCLTLEYLVQVYSIPINSFFYVWVLTLSMASVATFVFLRTKRVEFRALEKISIIQFCWVICILACLLLIGFVLLSKKLELHILLTLLCVIIGTGYLVHGIATVKNSFSLIGIGWWIGAAVTATRDGSESLAVLAFQVILLTVLPLIIEMRQKRTGFLWAA